MNLDQLEAERSRCTTLMHRLKHLQNVNKTLQENDVNVIDAAHLALSTVSSDHGMTIVAAMTCALMELEAKALVEAGVEFAWHNFFPGVTFNGFSNKDREEGSPISGVNFSVGADGAVVRAIQQVCGANGAWVLSPEGKLLLTVSAERRYTPPVTEL